MKQDRFTLHRLTAGVALTCLLGATAGAEVRLPHVLSDHMMLQREMPIRIWGWANPGEDVTVTLNEHQASTSTGDDEAWEVLLPEMDAGGPYDLTVAGANALTVSNVLIGELWMCSGQSNMELGLVSTRDHDADKATADYANIRLLTLRGNEVDEPQDDVDVNWVACSPRTVSYFSAVAYYFGRELHEELEVPVGLIMSAVSGTRIEPWTPAAGVKVVPELAGIDEPKDGKLYNKMIHPFTPLVIRGVIWYQGEGNVGDGMLYYHRMRALIHGWRKAWSRSDMPFYYVQIAPLNWGGKPKTQHAEIWEAQTAALGIPHTGMVVTSDIGNPGNAHPKNKKDVGKRLARCALAKTFGRDDIVCSSPIYRSMAVEGNKIRITFDHAETGLLSRDGKPLTWFTIAGDDKKFVAAQAEIVPPEKSQGGDWSILVWSDTVEAPVAVRFAWHQIAEPNLMNGAGLPAPAFRTDK